jgi:hypothetical protein
MVRYYDAARQLDDRSALPLLWKGEVYYQIDDRTAALRAWHDAEITIGAGTEDEDYRQEAKERPVVRKITDLWREYGLRQ